MNKINKSQRTALALVAFGEAYCLSNILFRTDIDAVLQKDWLLVSIGLLLIIFSIGIGAISGYIAFTGKRAIV